MTRSTEPVTPHSLDAERALIGGILVAPERYDDVADTVSAEDFFREAQQRIWRAIAVLAAQHRVVNFVTLKEHLKARDDLEEVGGPAYLASLTDGVPLSANVSAYAEIVRDRAERRRLQQAVRRIAADADDVTLDTAMLIETAQQRIFEVARATSERQFIDAPDLAARGFRLMKRLVEGPKGVTGVPTGFSNLDAMTRGLQPGTFTVLGARPSMGKTSLALNIAGHAARHGHHVAFFSLEMSADELAVRLLADSARIDGHRLQSGYMSQKDYPRLAEALRAIGDSALHVDDSPHVGPFELRRKARWLKATTDLGLIVVDYLQLMQLPARAENRNLAVAEVSRFLKLLARELDVPVLALSQLCREAERRNGQPLQLADLRDSGSLEQDADLVLFIHRPEAYAPRPENSGIAEIIVAKQRNGPTGTVRLRWCAENTRFENLGPTRA